MKGLLIVIVLLFISGCTTTKETADYNVKFQKVRSKCLFDAERDTFKYKTCIKENMPE